jgi:hypothetical protein
MARAVGFSRAVYRLQKTEALCLLPGRKRILVADVPFRREL